MHKTFLIIFFTLFIQEASFSQTNNAPLQWDQYFHKIQEADSLFLTKDYYNSAKYYSEAFKFNNQQFATGNRYKAAKAWAMAGQRDSAINNLMQEVNLGGFSEYKKLVDEHAFKKLHSTTGWNKLKSEVKNNEDRENKKLGRYNDIKQNLEKLLDLDQVYRLKQTQLNKNSQFDSNENKKLIAKMKLQDQSNLKYVSMLLDKYGWLSYDTIGYKANSVLFLVIQHSDSATQEKYLPLLRNAVKGKKAITSHLALLEDRVLIRQGKRQIYGSQVQCDVAGKNCSVLPIEDEKNVDIRRLKVGLNPLSEYLKAWNIIYKIPN